MSAPPDEQLWARQLRTASLMRMLLLALGITLTAYALIFTTVNVADRVLLYPSRHELPSYGAERRVVAHDGGELEVWAARSRQGVEPRAFVLRFYGNADRAERHVAYEASRYREQSVELWGVNYPGFGGSSGRATLSGVARSAEVAYAALAEQARGRPIFVAGTSMGTTAALHLAATAPVAGVTLHDAPPLAELLVGEHGAWNLWALALPVSWQIPRQLDSIGNASRSKAPAVFVISEQDTLVPPRYQRMIADAYAGPKETFVVPGAGHTGAIPGDISEQIARSFARMYEAATRREPGAPGPG